MLCVLAVFSATPSVSAGGSDPRVLYVDKGFDPDDRPIDETSCCQQDPDIKSTTRKLWVDQRDRRWLTITFQAYETFIGYWRVIVRLDSLGGPRADYRMRVLDDGTLVHCRVTSRRTSASMRGVARQGLFSGAPAACRVPLQFVHRNKRIRWKLFSPPEIPGEGNESGIIERAPDTGWYV